MRKGRGEKCVGRAGGKREKDEKGKTMKKVSKKREGVAEKGDR